MRLEVFIIRLWSDEMHFLSHEDTFNVFNNSFVFFGNLDLRGCIIDIRGKKFQSASTSTQSLSGKKISELFPNRHSVTNDALEKAIVDANISETCLYLDCSVEERKNVRVQMFLYPVFNDSNTAARIFFYALEVSGENKENQAASFSKTDDEVARLSSAEIEKANRNKDFFVAFISHELRSPLNTILGWTKILLTKDVNETARKNALEIIEKNARLQARLIEDLVDSAKLTSGKVRLELIETNIAAILKTVCESQKPAANAKKVDLEYSLDDEYVLIFGDSVRLQQIVTILIASALKTTSSGGFIKVKLQTVDAEAVITVRDSGQGIGRESLPDIFDQFRQNDENKTFNSNALGFSIVKSLAEKHGGRVRAESEGIGFGSTFTVVLPLINAKSKATAKLECL